MKMNSKALLTMAACGFALGSCAWWEGHAAEAKAVVCKEKTCRVAVTVNACKVSVDPDVLGIFKGVRDVEIVWEIKSQGAVFVRENPISFKPKDRDAAAKQFSSPALLDEKRFRWRDANSAPGQFHYEVRVIDKGTTCPPLDPTVVNEM
jgi:hypothetical protein